ncbi:MAG: four helix bundle protein [Clostridiales bacterium]|nr:four helix bundle protein [Clostridiales bacterium]MDD7260834.1 four helix bundle protein [Eubacteriales bacterium]
MNNAIEEKSFQFAVRIVKLCRYLCDEKKEFILSKQLLRAGTSIGANIAESQQAQSRPDFISKLCIALKEASETNYWLRLLRATDYLSETEYRTMIVQCKELERLLTSILKSAKPSEQ